MAGLLWPVVPLISSLFPKPTQGCPAKASPFTHTHVQFFQKIYINSRFVVIGWIYLYVNRICRCFFDDPWSLCLCGKRGSSAVVDSRSLLCALWIFCVCASELSQVGSLNFSQSFKLLAGFLWIYMLMFRQTWVNSVGSTLVF